MTRTEYLTQLAAHLHVLNEQELADVLDYFNEYFDECQDDAKAIEELGNPKEAAEEILTNLGKETSTNNHHYQYDFGADVKVTLDKEFKEKVKSAVKENFFKSFFKHFSVKYSSQETTVSYGPFDLADFHTIQLDLEYQSLSISTSPSNTAQITYEMAESDYQGTFFHRVEEGILYLHSYDEVLMKQIHLQLPSSLHAIKGQLEDSNLSLQNVSTGTLTLEAQGSNLNFLGLHAQELRLTSEDSNLNVKNSKLENAQLDLEDSNLIILDTPISQQMTITAEDCKLIVPSDLSQKTNYRIELEDGMMNTPPSLVGHTQIEDDITIFTTQYEEATALITIKAEDSMLVVK